MQARAALTAILEASIYLGLLLFLVQQKSLILTLKALRPPYTVFLAVLVIVMLGAQLLDRGRDTFPFVGWAMYVRPTYGDPQYYDYSAVLQSGREIRLDVFRVSRSLSYRLMWPLKSMARRIEQATDDWQYQAMIDDYQMALQSIARMYNRRHLDDPIRTIHVWHCTIPLHVYRGPSSIQRRLFWHLPVQ